MWTNQNRKLIVIINQPIFYFFLFKQNYPAQIMTWINRNDNSSTFPPKDHIHTTRSNGSNRHPTAMVKATKIIICAQRTRYVA